VFIKPHSVFMNFVRFFDLKVVPFYSIDYLLKIRD
jgi:hypothetical protein